MKFGYARVSKNEQSLDVQIQKLKAAGCEEIFQIRERVKAGLDSAKQKGRKGGRPKALI